MKRILIFILLLGLILSGLGYFALFSKQINQHAADIELYINSSDKMVDFHSKIKKHQSSLSLWTLPLVSKMMGFNEQQLKAGRYHLSHPLSNVELIRRVRAGIQNPLDVVIFNGETLEDLAGIAGRYLEKDSIDFLNYFLDYADSNNKNFNRENLLTLFIPNTYEMYWNCDPECFTNRMIKEFDKFWTADRKKALLDHHLDPINAYTLASIVEKESQAEKERSTIAGLYLNRLRRGILLQADPTVVFASGEKGLRRVLNKHLSIDSPYNTYLYSGLPPGPITMPSLKSIQAVIHPKSHAYIYMCAKPGYAGEHLFSSSLQEHNRNARVYQNWLNSERIF